MSSTTRPGGCEPPERRRIGLVPQQLDLFPNLSVRDNVGFPLRARGVARSAALATADELGRADAVVVIAGMEGALASLVGGLVACPVIAVPTSAGYGAALEGVTALLAMHASCAAGVTVVGIDNGFGAAGAVARILR